MNGKFTCEPKRDLRTAKDTKHTDVDCTQSVISENFTGIPTTGLTPPFVDGRPAGQRQTNSKGRKNSACAINFVGSNQYTLATHKFTVFIERNRIKAKYNSHSTMK